MKLERILVPVDFSAGSRKALDLAADWAQRFDATIEVLYVWSPPHYISPDLTLAIPGWNGASLEQYARTEAVKDMERFMASTARPGLKATSRIEVGRPAAAIVRAATEDRADLIVMGTHGLTGVSRALLGSVTQEVVAK